VKEAIDMTDELMTTYDVVVIGGGAAGLNGALVLARSRRSVAVIDAGAPRNRPAEGVHGLFGHDGIPPAELLERGRAEVRRYGGHVVDGDVATATRDGDGFVVSLADSRTVRARRLLIAAGLMDELPDIVGLRARWGRDVLHCPYCHGWEVRDQVIGVLATGPRSMHQVLLFRQLSDDVTYFINGGSLDERDAEQLAARGIRVVDGRVRAVDVSDDRLAGVRLDDGTLVPVDALALMPRMVARATFLADLGLRLAPHPSGLGDHLPVDATGSTNVAGVWAAGNVTDLSAQVGGSAAAGAFAGMQINADLVTEEAELALSARRASA
jgi:thioredoxin reductase